ncbi:MAG: radical SAM protein, partial [Hyphomicrobium sp.]
NLEPHFVEPVQVEDQGLVAKFTNPDWTAKGEQRASVPLDRLDTLWINTGTLCNITCASCYIESSPINDRLAYITADEVAAYLDEIATLRLGTREIGFTGGEPFMNPQILPMIERTLSRGFEVLVLTNAMQPMQRPAVKRGLLALKERFGVALKLRVSLDHHSQVVHDAERGEGSWKQALTGLDWLSAQGFHLAIAGRTRWQESPDAARADYGALFARRGWPLDAANAAHLMMLPEMDEKAEVPEITTRCWTILDKSPSEMMCASSRMIVKRKGADKPTVLPCTLLPYIESFEMGATLDASLRADGGMFTDGAVKLCHPHCAKFCVLGGGSCSA